MQLPGQGLQLAVQQTLGINSGIVEMNELRCACTRVSLDEALCVQPVTSGEVMRA